VRTHKPEIVEGSVQRQVLTHGVSFMIRCCGEHAVSVHIQNAGRFSPDEIRRVRDDYLQEVAEQHENLLAAEEAILGLDEPLSGYSGCCED
jgi:hypothetical protein